MARSARDRCAPSEIHGLGLFAAEPISEGEIVEVVGGTTITDAEVREVIDKGDRYDGITIDKDVNLRIDPPDWPGIHGNHSCDPNLWMADAVSIVARGHIDTGAELTIDYALLTVSADWSLLCACGSEQCRRVIRG